NTGREEASRRLFFSVTELMNNLYSRRAREERHPIVTSLAVSGDVVAYLLKGSPREGGVGDFGLLQTEDGRVVYSKPGQDALLADAYRVNIPGRDPYPSFHLHLPPQRV